MKFIVAAVLSLISIQLSACNTNLEIEPESKYTISTTTDTMKLKITIGTNTFTATCYNNATATVFKAKLPMTIHMKELNGNEKYFNLSYNLPVNASNPGTIQKGDLMIYEFNTLVIFYKTFSTSYRYSRLGRIDNPSELADALGSGSVSVTFELE